MSTRVLLHTFAIIVIAAAALPASAQLYVTCDISGDIQMVTSNATAEYRDYWFNIDPYMFLSMSHVIDGPKPVTGAGASGYGKINSTASVTNFSYQWDNIPSGCYRATANSSAQKDSAEVARQTASSAQKCVTATQTTGGGNDGNQGGSGGDGCTWSTSWCSGNSPIIINFDDGDYALTGANAPVWFDINATGTPVAIGWTAREAQESFLWRDLNGNGRVDSGAELFGTATRLRNGTRATNGFEALRELDDDGDGVIDANDAAWPSLLLWRDANHDGVSTADEVTRVTGSTLRSITLAYHRAGRADSFGNFFRYESTIWFANARGHVRAKPVYDIFFTSVQ